jgi:hypothetical protein
MAIWVGRAVRFGAEGERDLADGLGDGFGGVLQYKRKGSDLGRTIWAVGFCFF